jgi:hypothetical protein
VGEGEAQTKRLPEQRLQLFPLSGEGGEALVRR